MTNENISVEQVAENTPVEQPKQYVPMAIDEMDEIKQYVMQISQCCTHLDGRVQSLEKILATYFTDRYDESIDAQEDLSDEVFGDDDVD